MRTADRRFLRKLPWTFTRRSEVDATPRERIRYFRVRRLQKAGLVGVFNDLHRFTFTVVAEGQSNADPR